MADDPQALHESYPSAKVASMSFFSKTLPLSYPFTPRSAVKTTTGGAQGRVLVD